MAHVNDTFAAKYPRLAALARNGLARQLEPGDLLIREGDHGDSLYVLITGRMKVFGRAGADGREIFYGHCEPGDYVGEMGLDGGSRIASVQALEPCEVISVNREGVLNYLREDPSFALELLGKVMRRIRSTQIALRSLQAARS
jgi:CRP/FNR family cyclic AMP-dependent transcriptional regulator